MRKFYQTYRADENTKELALQLPWTHNLIILSQSKRQEERELERQFKSALFERTVLSPPKVTPLVSQMHPEANSFTLFAFDHSCGY